MEKLVLDGKVVVAEVGNAPHIYDNFRLGCGEKTGPKLFPGE